HCLLILTSPSRQPGSASFLLIHHSFAAKDAPATAATATRLVRLRLGCRLLGRMHRNVFRTKQSRLRLFRTRLTFGVYEDTSPLHRPLLILSPYATGGGLRRLLISSGLSSSAFSVSSSRRRSSHWT